MRKTIYFIILILTTLSCRKEATIWYSDWVFPVVKDTLDLKNLTNDSTLSISNGVYFLDLSRKIASISPEKIIQIPDTSIRQGFAIALNSLTVQPGTSFINNNEDHIFDLGDIQLKKIRAKKGKIRFELLNPVNTKTFYEIELPSVTLNNQSIKRNLIAEAGTGQNPSATSIEIDLTGYFIDLTGSNGNKFNALASKIKVQTDPSGSLTTLYGSDSTIVTIKMEDIEIDYARGYFGNSIIADTYTFEPLFLKEQNNLSLDLSQIKLDFRIENGIKASAKANIKKINNSNTYTNNSVDLSHSIINNPFVIQSATGAWNTLQFANKLISLDNSNSNLEAFIENVGNQTSAEFEVEINPYGNISGGWDEFFPNSSVDLYLDVQMPLDIKVNNLLLSEKYAVNLTQNKEKTNVVSGQVIVKTENTFPYQGEFLIEFLDANANIIPSSNTFQKINSSLFGTLNKYNILSSKNELIFDFPAEIIGRIEEVRFVQVSFKLNTPTVTANQLISIPEKAFLKLNMNCNFKLENRIGK